MPSEPVNTPVAASDKPTASPVIDTKFRELRKIADEFHALGCENEKLRALNMECSRLASVEATRANETEGRLSLLQRQHGDLQSRFLTVAAERDQFERSCVDLQTQLTEAEAGLEMTKGNLTKTDRRLQSVLTGEGVFNCPFCKGLGCYGLVVPKVGCDWCNASGSTSMRLVQEVALRSRRMLDQARANVMEERGQFKNFHARLCERFGYMHDEKDWKRDQLSLEEWIARRFDESKVGRDILESARHTPNVTAPVAIEQARASARLAELDLRKAVSTVATDAPADRLAYVILFELVERLCPLVNTLDNVAAIVKGDAA